MQGPADAPPAMMMKTEARRGRSMAERYTPFPVRRQRHAPSRFVMFSFQLLIAARIHRFALCSREISAPMSFSVRHSGGNAMDQRTLLHTLCAILTTIVLGVPAFAAAQGGATTATLSGTVS